MHEDTNIWEKTLRQSGLNCRAKERISKTVCMSVKKYFHERVGEVVQRYGKRIY
jgi:hypothetical protein